MKVIGRIVTRPVSEENGALPDIIIGVCSRTQTSLKGNTVYELTDFDGTLILKEVGESWMTYRYNGAEGSDGWSSEISCLMRNHGNTILLSATELQSKE